MEEEDDDAAEAFIRAAVAGQVSLASAANWTTAAPAAAATGAGRHLTGREAAATINGSFSAAAFAAAARASSLSAAAADGGQEEVVHRAVASPFRNSVPRTWRSTPHKAPIVARQSAEIATSKDILERVSKLINKGNVRTHLRNLMPVLGNAISDALGLSVPLAKTRLEWWPRKDDKELWSLRVQLSYEIRRKADNRVQDDDFARPVTVSLPGFFCQRDKVNTEVRQAHLVVLLQMEEAARVAFEVYLSKNKPKALCGGRRHKDPSLASVGALRAAPRVVPLASEFAARHVVPLSTVHNSPARRSDRVTTFSKDPTPLPTSPAFPCPHCLHLYPHVRLPPHAPVVARLHCVPPNPPGLDAVR